MNSDIQEKLEVARIFAYDHFPALMVTVSRYRWKVGGRSDRPSHGVKHRALQEYAGRFHLKMLVETGTYRGHMVASTKKLFEVIYSIELDADFHQAARKRFARISHIHLIRGDSAKALPKVLACISAPALFWLDAHYSGLGTARADVDTPILAELLSVLSHPIRGHVVLIDDASDFNGANDYPTIQELREFVTGLRPTATIEVRNNIIRIF